jgi:HK97 gp10 family phage protein
MPVEGVAKLNRQLAAMGAAARQTIGAELDRSANDIAGLAKALAPTDEGDLKASIAVEPGKNELARKVVAGSKKAFYPRWVEHGHDHVKARPFFFPAYRALRRALRQRLGRAYRKAAKAVAAGGGGDASG